MTYGDLSMDAPFKPKKGFEDGACNRQSCQAEPANWYNHGSGRWYCSDCKHDIGEDRVNKLDWMYRHEPHCGHPMFETREQITARQLSDDEAKIARGECPPYEGFYGKPDCDILNMDFSSVEDLVFNQYVSPETYRRPISMGHVTNVHYADTRLSNLPHFTSEKPLTKRQLRRQKGRK